MTQDSHYSLGRAAFQRTLIRTILYPVGLMLMLIGVFLWQLHELNLNAERVERSDTVIDHANSVLELMIDMETGLRGYLLTGEPVFLEPYQIAQTRIDDEIALLGQLVVNPEQIASVASLQIEVAGWRQFAQTTLQSQADATPGSVITEQRSGKQAMDGIRQRLAEFIGRATRLRTERLRSAQATTRSVVIASVVLGLTIGVLLALLTYQQLRRLAYTYEKALANAHHQAEETDRQRERLQGVLNSIADAVIVTNAAGTIVFSNPVTQSLTGWPPEETVGQPLASVYKTVNSTHKTQESLLTPVGASTEVQSPAEVVKFLVRRDGVETPIEDSAAPIYNALQVVTGSVIVFRDVSARMEIVRERERLLEAQTAYTEMLSQSNEQLQHFAYIASHDLQEPLRTVISFLQLLELRYAEQLDGDAKEFIAFAVDGAVRMKALITALLTYSRIDMAEDKQYERFPIKRALDKALLNLAVTIAETQASVTQDNLPSIEGDEIQITQLFQNLIANAIKFRGEKQAHVHIGVQASGAEWRFCISDNGIGIPAEHVSRVFIIFQRLHTRGEYPGTGIGLAICKKVVERHHGRIWVESTLGQGTKFYFTLPV